MSADDINKLVNGIMGNTLPGINMMPSIKQIGKNAVSGAEFLASLSWPRVIAILLGLLLVAAAIFSFRPVRETVVTTGKAAAKIAAA
jgi:hypothetical protein